MGNKIYIPISPVNRANLADYLLVKGGQYQSPDDFLFDELVTVARAADKQIRAGGALVNVDFVKQYLGTLKQDENTAPRREELEKCVENNGTIPMTLEDLDKIKLDDSCKAEAESSVIIEVGKITYELLRNSAKINAFIIAKIMGTPKNNINFQGYIHSALAEKIDAALTAHTEYVIRKEREELKPKVAKPVPK